MDTVTNAWPSHGSLIMSARPALSSSLAAHAVGIERRSNQRVAEGEWRLHGTTWPEGSLCSLCSRCPQAGRAPRLQPCSNCSEGAAAGGKHALVDARRDVGPHAHHLCRAQHHCGRSIRGACHRTGCWQRGCTCANACPYGRTVTAAAAGYRHTATAVPMACYLPAAAPSQRYLKIF